MCVCTCFYTIYWRAEPIAYDGGGGVRVARRTRMCVYNDNISCNLFCCNLFLSWIYFHCCVFIKNIVISLPKSFNGYLVGEWRTYWMLCVEAYKPVLGENEMIRVASKKLITFYILYNNSIRKKYNIILRIDHGSSSRINWKHHYSIFSFITTTYVAFLNHSKSRIGFLL